MSARLRARASRRRERGQGLVEFAVVLPLFLFILLAMLEFGFLFDHLLTVQYGSREGARVGSALVNGGGELGCGFGQSPHQADVDPLIIAAVNRVLTSPGSRVDISQVPTIRIYEANANGAEAGPVNVWRYRAGATAVVDGVTLTLNYEHVSTGWQACDRRNVGSPPDSIGVSLSYTYRMQTTLGNIMGMFGGSGPATLTVGDRTVMAMNPTDR